MEQFFGIGGVAAITAISYLVGMVVKATPWNNNKVIPIACALSGMVLGVAGMYVMPDFPASDPITAMAVGIASGWAATGINQTVKQLGGANE